MSHHGSVSFVLDEASRQSLLKAFPAKHAEVGLKHIRHKCAANEKDLHHCCAKNAKVVGLHEADGIQVLTLEINDSCHQQTIGRTGDKYYNVILSCDPKKTHLRRADEMVSGIALKGGEKALYNLEKPIEVRVQAHFRSIDGQTVIVKPPEPEPEGPGLIEEAGAAFKRASTNVRGTAKEKTDMVLQAADGVKQGVRGILTRFKLFR